jgi:hypothetical protein
MMRKLFSSMVVAAAIVTASASQVHAQVSKDYMDVGAVIGLGGIGSASASFGGRFEKIFKELPDLGGGLLGIGVSADYYGYNFGGGYSLSYIPIGATANYHFKLDNKKIDPFLGAGLGFQVVNCSGAGLSGFGCGGYSSGVYFIGRAGARYFLTDKLAAYADVGAGAATINLGITFKLK